MAGGSRVLGVMSGSSLDGLDLACCDFQRTDDRWTFQTVSTSSAPFPPELRARLLGAMGGSSLDLARLHRDFGVFIGEACVNMTAGLDAKPDLIASHGHTIFHKPAEGLTTQIGCGAHIATIAGMPTVCDFRTKDVALGGQGAPLVPLGERDLFPSHRAFLNLGGIANISVHGVRVVGYDICPCNQALNMLAEEAGQHFDEDGTIARSGKINQTLLDQLNSLPFYQQAPPRSLGREWFDGSMRPLIAGTTVPMADRLRTAVEHIATLISEELKRSGAARVLATGGGARNGFLVKRLRALSGVIIEVPEAGIVDFKEAMIFAYLGLLRWRSEVNTLASVTGARGDSIGGALYLPN